MGYLRGTRGYIFYSPQDKKTFVSTNAKFIEEDYVSNFKPRSRLVLEELSGDVVVMTPSRSAAEPIMKEVSSKPAVEKPRRSGRITKGPERFMSYGETLVAVADHADDDPASYREAIVGAEVNLWKSAMDT